MRQFFPTKKELIARKNAAKSGDLFSQIYLGLYYEEQNDVLNAAKWYYEAAKQDDKDTLCALFTFCSVLAEAYYDEELSPKKIKDVALMMGLEVGATENLREVLSIFDRCGSAAINPRFPNDEDTRQLKQILKLSPAHPSSAMSGPRVGFPSARY